MNSARRWLSDHGFFAVLMMVIAPMYVAWTWSDQLGDLGGDDAFYLMMAQAYSPFVPHDELFAKVAATSRFPPLYPLWLALTGASSDLLAAHLATTLILFVALSVLYAWLLQCGVSRIHAAGVALVSALLPQTFQLGLWPQSEYLYLALSLAVLWALERYRTQPTLAIAVFAAVATSLAALTRTIGVALIPAVTIAFVLGPRRRDLLLLLVAAALPVLWSALHPSPDSYLHILQAAYGDSNALKRFTQQLLGQPILFRFGFAGNFLQTTGLLPAVDALGVALVAALLVRLRSLRADAVYCLSYAAILALWPYPEEIARLLWPLIPIALGAAVIEAARLGERMSATIRELSVGLVIASAFLIGMPMLLFTADRWTMTADGAGVFKHWRDWYQVDPRKAIQAAQLEVAIVDLLRRLPDSVPRDACVVSIKPQLIEYFAHRQSSQPPLNSVPDPEFQRQLRATGCPFIAMLGLQDKLYPSAFHPADRIRTEIETVDWDIIENPVDGSPEMAGVLARLKPAPSPP